MKRTAILAGVILCGAAALVPGTAGAKLKLQPGAYAHPGGHLLLKVEARPGPGPRGRLTVALSADRRLGRHDLVLKKNLKAPATGRHRTFRLKVPDRASTGSYRLLACHRKRCQVGGKVKVTDPSIGTLELTNRAVQANRLSKSRAIVYRVWAVLGNHRLPRKYQGDVDATDHGALLDAIAARSWMKPIDRRQIARLLLPPTAWVGANGKARASRADASATASREVSGYTTCEQQATTEHWSVLTGKYVRIWWWREHGANRKAAAGLVRAADRTIWDAYRKLMGVTPPSDAGRKCDGGDGHYDIYLLPKSVIPDTSTFRAVTLPFAPPCSGSPAFTEFNTHGGGDPPTRFELATRSSTPSSSPSRSRVTAAPRRSTTGSTRPPRSGPRPGSTRMRNDPSRRRPMKCSTGSTSGCARSTPSTTALSLSCWTSRTGTGSARCRRSTAPMPMPRPAFRGSTQPCPEASTRPGGSSSWTRSTLRQRGASSRSGTG
ncbi:MAG: hypothetical protein J0H66_14015 [Solirubrobacterales bacterium]|nr:hypothetical protein [Solirubrobacterales bacterium]